MRSFLFASIIAVTALLALPGCPDTGASFGGGGAATTSSPSSGGGGSGATTTSAGGAGGAPITGPVVRIHLRASTKPFPQTDGLSGQTPLSHASGIRKFQLFKDASDTSPVTVFDHGNGYVEAGYGDGDDTVVGTVVAKTLPAGTYTLGRVVHSHVRYRVAATVHAGGLDVPGEFENLQIMSDHTEIDGVIHDHGHYEIAFHAGGQTFPTSGEGAPEPVFPSSGGFSVKIEEGQWAYYFPTAVVIVPETPVDVDVVMEVNMFESFRWMDQIGGHNAPLVFDVTPPTFEPVLRFGANSYAVYVE